MKLTYEDVLAQAIERKDHLSELCLGLFSEKTITLEIGCGHGHFLTAYAEAYSEEICVGIDLLYERILKSKKKQEDEALKNLHFLKADAVEFLEALPESIILDDVFILFPDPWPKKKHHKHRLIQEPFLNLLAQKSSENTRLYFRTDFDEYFDWSKEIISNNKHWNLCDESPWPFEKETVFQKKMGTYQSLIAVKA